LIFWVIFKISETGIKKQLFFVCDWRILGGSVSHTILINSSRSAALRTLTRSISFVSTMMEGHSGYRLMPTCRTRVIALLNAGKSIADLML
jgi:hypothetical protein